jgi:hypothetical protein
LGIDGMESIQVKGIWEALLGMILAVALWGPAGPAAAQEQERKSPNRWHWSTFTVGNSDLQSNSVNALAPAADGALWVGTYSGLARLVDGQVEQVLTTDQGLPNDIVRALASGANGALWVGTAEGLAQLVDGQVEQVLTTERGLPDNAVLALLPTGEGALWVGTADGLAQLVDGQVEQVVTIEQGLPDNFISAVSPADDGALWVGTHGGLARLRAASTRPEIVKFVGQSGAEDEAKITQAWHTFAVIAFDPKYQTDGREWRFLWRLDSPSGESKEVSTRSSYYEGAFEEDAGTS